MIEREIRIQTADGESDGWFYQPEKNGSWPGVIFLTDIGSIRQSQQETAQRICAQGNSVVLPNIFYRVGKPPLLAAWGGKFESETYAGAHHSWTTLDSPVYNRPQAERAFEKLMALFAATLRG